MDELHPYGWTDRGTYRLAILGCLAAIVALSLLPDALWAFFLILPLSVATFLVLLLLTIRRLRDAGWSVWWALPLGISFRPPLADLWFGEVAVPLGDVISILVLLTPISIGLLARSSPHTARVA